MSDDHEKTKSLVGDFDTGQKAAERLLHGDGRPEDDGREDEANAFDPGAEPPPEPQGLWERLIAYSNPVVSAELTDALQVFENDDMAAYDAIRSAIKLIAAVREALVVDPSDGTLRWRADTMTLILAADKLTGNLKIRSGTQDHDKVAKPGEHLHVRYDGGQVFVRIFSDIRRGP